MMKISNKYGAGFVKGCQIFRGSNVFGEWRSKHCYVVYSYGYHFPMYVKLRGAWYENKDKYSRTTSKQQNQYRPDVVIVDELSTDELQAKIAAQVAEDAREQQASSL
jgi:hypothetical protein